MANHLMSDDFERADSSTLGSNWVTLSGYSSPAIYSGEVYTTAAQAKAYWGQKLTVDALEAHVVIGSIYTSTSDNTMHISVNPTVNAADFQSYVYFNFHYTGWSAGCRDAGGGYNNRVSGSWTLSDGDDISIRRDGTSFTIKRNGATVRTWTDSAAPQGTANRYIGLTCKSGVVRVDGVYVDDLVPPPVASAGPDQMVLETDTVNLDGTATTVPSGHSATYAWTVQDADGTTLTNGDISNSNTLTPSFHAPAVAEGTKNIVLLLTVTDTTTSKTSTDTVTVSVVSTRKAVVTMGLTVTDSKGATGFDTMHVTILGNTPPVAVASGPSGVVAGGATGTLDASASHDAQDPGSALTFTWSQTSGPTASLHSPNNAVATFSAPVQSTRSTLVFKVTVVDTGGASDTATVTVQVGAVLSGSGSLTANSAVMADATRIAAVAGPVVIAAELSTGAAGIRSTFGATDITGALTVAAHPVEVAAYGVWSVTADGVVSRSLDAAIVARSSVTANAQHLYPGASDVVGAWAMTADGVRATPAVADIRGILYVDAMSYAQVYLHTDIAAEFELYANSADVVIDVQSYVEAPAFINMPLSAGLASESSVTSSVFVAVPVTADVTAKMDITADGEVSRPLEGVDFVSTLDMGATAFVDAEASSDVSAVWETTARLSEQAIIAELDVTAAGYVRRAAEVDIDASLDLEAHGVIKNDIAADVVFTSTVESNGQVFPFAFIEPIVFTSAFTNSGTRLKGATFVDVIASWVTGAEAEGIAQIGPVEWWERYEVAGRDIEGPDSDALWDEKHVPDVAEVDTGGPETSDWNTDDLERLHAARLDPYLGIAEIDNDAVPGPWRRGDE